MRLSSLGQGRRTVHPHPATWLNGKRWEDEVKPSSNVHQFPQSRHIGFAERDYTAGLVQREDGTYAL